MNGLASLGAAGVPEEVVGEGPLPIVRRWPRIVVVLEGQAKAAGDAHGLDVVRAAGSGDDEIVAQVARHAGQPITVVTADRGLIERVTALGARTSSPGRLLDLLGS
jgi:hypothetical protein